MLDQIINTHPRMYWRLQLLGWAAVIVQNILARWLVGKAGVSSTIALVMMGCFGFVASIVLHRLLKSCVQYRPMPQVVVLSVFYSTALGIFAAYATLFSLNEIPFLFVDKNLLTDQHIVRYGLSMSSFLIIWSMIYIVIIGQRKLGVTIQNKAELESSLKTMQLEMLQNQLNPHFIFNALNNVRALILEDTEKAREIIARMADVMRYTLADNQRVMISLSEELKVIQDYLAICKIQFEDRLSIDINVDDDCIACDVPKMMLHLLVENAIKHGISESLNGGALEVKVTKNTSWLTIQVCNPGDLDQHFPCRSIENNACKNSFSEKNTNTFIGMENISRRLLLIYGQAAKFAIKKAGDTVIASIIIPLVASPILDLGQNSSGEA